MTTYLVDDGAGRHEVKIDRDDGSSASVLVDGVALQLRINTLADGTIAVQAGGRTRRFRTFSDAHGRWLSEGPRQRCFEVVDERESWLSASGGADGADGDIKASMPGRVVKVAVVVGDVVQPGDVVAVLEAMKMENDVKSKIAATVVEVAVAVGEAVETGQLMLKLEPAA